MGSLENKHRCAWANKTQIEADYHDKEWGVPVQDDRLHFEMISLEGAQAGLSWSTVLTKRENYRQLFDFFDPETIKDYGDEKILSLMQNSGIIRNRLKLYSVVNNAKCFIRVQEEFGSFNSYIWSFVDYKSINNSWEELSEVPSSTSISDAISKDMKKRGFKFVGTTIIYAYMQAVGMVNDHIVSCFRYQDIACSLRQFSLHKA